MSAQLSQIVKRLNDGWVAEWDNNEQPKYTIVRYYSKLSIDNTLCRYSPFAFKSKEIAEYSLEHHRQLWEQYNEL